MFDAINELRVAGHAVDMLSSEQQQVLAELTKTEVDVLISLKRRLDSVGPEVQGQEIKLL